MSVQSVYRRREALGIKDRSVADCLKVVKDYAAIAKADSRRYLWLIQYACEQVAQEIDRLEQEFVIAEQFSREKQSKEIHERLNLLEQDFNFLDAIFQIIKEQGFGAIGPKF